VIIFGVINASPDSLATASIAASVPAALERGRSLLADGADAIDLGGQGSTDAAELVDWTTEWERVRDLVPALAALGVDVSIDSWRPEVVRRALDAADGMQHDEMWQIAADYDVLVVVPFLAGPDPKSLRHTGPDPIARIAEFFEHRLRTADRYGLRSRCLLDPGTGFGPANWSWEDRYRYQKAVYADLGALRRFDLPLYVALPWKETAQHDELLDLIVRQRPEYGRAHVPAKVRAVERRLNET
jgi:dihydropteroate synthase